MRSTLIATWLTAALGAACLGAQEPPNDPQNPRGELESLAIELDAAVRRVSQDGVEPILGSEPARGYYVPGLGAMFVVPPRSIPREERLQALRSRPRGAPGVAISPTNDPEYPELEQLLGPEAAREYIARRQLDEQTRRELARNARQHRVNSTQHEEMRRLEQQVEAFQREAERARQEAERAWAEIMLEFQQRRDGGSGGSTAPAVSVGGGVPPAANAPGRGELRDPTATARFMEPPPPWRFWFGTDDPEDPRSPAQILTDVKTAIVAALEAHGGVLRNVGPQEQVTVAVDFLPRGLFVGMSRPARTLVVRVKKQFLEDRQAGRLGPEQLRAKLEVSEY